MAEGEAAGALRALLGGPELAWLRTRLRGQAARGKPLTGVVRHAAASPSERDAIARLMGHQVKGVLAVRLPALEALLRNAGLAGSLREALEAVEGPIDDEAAARRARAAAWDAAFMSVDAGEASWLAELRASGLLRRLAREPAAAERLLAQARAVRALLPAAGLLLAELAAQATGDAHALDRGGVLGTLALRGYAPPGVTAEDEGGAMAWRAAWERLGVACDDLSAPVLVLNLPADPGCPLGAAIGAYVALGSPYRLSLQQLARGLVTFSADRRGRMVYVCENPAVIAAAAERLGSRSCPLICLEGQPKAAAHRLLGQLAAAGARLHYHGDFDWPGITIGNLVMKRYGAAPWRFGRTDYLAAPKGLALSGAPVAAPWDAGLLAAMMDTGKAAHEEAVLDALLADLGATGSRSGWP